MTPWEIPMMWEGGECWIIGGGPSIPREFGVPEKVINGVLSGDLPLSTYSPFLSPIHDKHVIGVNAAFLLGEWIDAVFFGDAGFYFANKPELDAFSKLKISCNSNLPKKQRDINDVKYVPLNLNHSKGISSQENTVSWNLNSGAAAISLARWFGVRRIYLLGFDMELVDGAQHFHSHYRKNKKNDGRARDPKKLPFDRHKACFPMVANDAARIGLEIVNVSPDSGIKSFKRVKLSDVL
jgi:hypothetical protein